MEQVLDYASPASPRPNWYVRVPLYLKILVALILGVVAGMVIPRSVAVALNVPAVMVLRRRGAIAPPLILVAVVRALLGATVRGRLAGKMFGLLVLNTLVAIVIGLSVAKVIRPGRHASLPPGEVPHVAGNPLTQLEDNVPRNFLAP